MCISTSIERERDLQRFFLNTSTDSDISLNLTHMLKKMVKYNFVVDNYDFVN